MNRVTKLLVVAVMTLVIICSGWVPGPDFGPGTASAAVRMDDPNANGANGSTAKPYIINEPGDFEWILNNWNLAGSTELMQTRDIDLTGYAWTPLDGSWSGFRGKYDGNGHAISNLLIDDSTNTCVGLFGRLDGEALVKNINLVNASVTGRLPSAYIGGIVGMQNGGTIERCRVSGSVTGGNNDSVGGIAGYSGATIRYSSSSATVVTGAHLSGNQPKAGGVVGMSSGTVQDSYNTGSVTGGASSCVGGIAGFGYAGTFQSCYNTGVVTGSGINTGSIIGLIRTTDGVSGNYYQTGTAGAGIGQVDPGDASGSTVSNVGTTALSAAQMKSSGNYSWNFAGNTWTIQGGVNNGYPTLKGVPTLAPTLPVSGLTITTATSGGEVTAAGLGSISERGIQRMKSSESTYVTAAAGSGTGSFTTQMSGLDHSTSYYVRSYATNEVGTAYGEPIVFSTKSLLSVTLSPGTEIGMTSVTPAAAATSKFVVNITDASVGRVDANTPAPASGGSFVDNYAPSADLSLGVQIGRYLQIYDVDGAGLIKNYAEVRLELQHIKQPPVLSVSVTPGDTVGSTKATITGAATSRFVLNISASSFGQIVANQTAPTSGDHLIANYASGTTISSGVLKGRYLQIFDVDASNVIKGSYEVVLQATHIKQPPFSLPYHESFDDSTMPSTLHWEAISGGPLSWMVEDVGPYYGEQTRDGTGYMAFANASQAASGSAARLFLTSDFAIPADATKAEFSFWMFHLTPDWGVYDDNIQVQVSTNGGLNWSSLGLPLNAVVALSDPALDHEWVKHVFNLDAYKGSARLRVGLLGTADQWQDLMVDDLDIVVEVPIVEYTLAYAAGANGTLTGSASQTVQEGADGTEVVAVPNAGCHFVSWSDGIGTAARTDQGVTGAINVTANFAPNIAITVAADPQSKVYGTADPTLAYRLTSGALELGDSFSGALSREVGEGVGSYAIGKGTLSAGPKYNITFVGSSLTIAKRSIEVTANSLAKTYGGADPALTYGITQGSLVPGDEITGSLTRAAGEGVGSYQIGQGSLAVSANYELGFIPGTFTINPAALTVTADNKAKTYGGANPPLTATYSGFVLGQDPSVLGGTLTLTTPAAAGSGAGSYAITPSGLTSSNYAITFVDGTLTVNPASLTVTAGDKSKTYGSANPAFTATYSGFVLGQDPSVLGGALVFVTSAGSSSGVGTYAITPSGLTSSNYAITFVDGTLTVNPAPLTVTADDKSKPYGSANPAFTATYSGFVLGQDPSVLGGALVFVTSAAGSSGVGTYAISPLGLTSSNYAITFVDGTLTVNPASLTVTAGNKSKTYGNANPAFTVSYSGFVLGQDPSALGGTLTLTTPATVSSGAGGYPITPSGLTSSNYAITFVDGTLQVNPAALTVTAEDKSRIYGGANPDFTATYSGFVLGQDVSVLGGALTFTTPAVAGSDVGAYDITPSGLTSSNYAITFVDGTLTVTPAALTVSADNKTKTYGQPNPAFTASYTGFVAGDGPSALGGALTFTTPAVSSSVVGSYPVTPSGLTSSNYTITFVGGILQVNPAALIVTADDKAKNYGSENPALTASYSGFVLGQDPSALGGTLALVTTATASSGVGAYSVTPSGLTSSNYAITFVDGTLEVTRAALTVTAESKSKSYGSGNPAFAVTYSGFRLGQDPSALGGTLTFSTPAVNSSDVGTYAITPSGLTSSNYAITFVDGTLQVTPAALTVTADNKSKTYGSDNPAFTATYSGFVLGQNPSVLGGTLTFTTPAASGSNVGSYSIAPSGLTSSNYAATFVNGTLQVTPAALTVRVEDKIKTYGDANPAFTASYSGFVLGQNASVLGGSLTFTTLATTSSSVATYAVTPSGLTSSNYAIAFVDGTLAVDRAALTVTADGKSKTYGSDNPAFTATYSGFVLGQNASVLGGTLTFTTPVTTSSGVATYAVAPSGLTSGNYAITFVDGALAVNPAALTVTAENKSKTYGSDNPAFTAAYGGFVLGQDPSVLGGTLTFTTPAANGSNVGSYAITPSGLTSSNYTITYIPANLTITKKPINATGIGASDRVYDGGVVASLVLDGAGLDGAVIGDTVTLSTAAASGAFAHKNAGAGKTVTVSGLALSGADAGNYALQPYTTTASVTKKAVHAIDIIALNKVYDGKTKADLDKAAAGLSGIVGGDDLALVTDGAAGAFADKNVAAAKTVTVTGMALGGADEVNYALQPYTTSAAITKKAVYATDITAQNKIYDGKIEAGLDKAAAGLSGVVSEDDLALVTDSAVGTFADRKVGAGKTVTVTGLTLAGTDVENYALQVYTTPATITARPVSAVGITAVDKVYDRNSVVALNNTLAGLSGVVDGDSVTLVTVTTGTFDDENVGSAKAVTVSGLTLAGADAGNYDLQAYGTTATISPKPVSAIDIAAADKVYDSNIAATLNTSLAALDGVVTGDELILVTTGASGAFDDKDVGVDKTVTVAGLALDGGDVLNYQLQPYGTKADITARPITVTADAKTKVYGDGDPALTYQMTFGELVGEDAFSGRLTRAPGKSVGEYEILQNDLTAGGNYHLTYVSAKLTITPKSISAADIAARDKYWDGVAAASLSTVSASLVGLEVGDDVHLDVSKASGAFADARLGVSKPVTVTGLALTGADAGNYQLNPYTTTASIVEEPEPPKPPTPPTGNGGVVIIVNGETQDDSATATTSTEGEKTVTTVVIDPDKLDKRLEEEGENATVTVPVNTGADVVVGELTGQTVKNMETKSAVLEIKTERVTYTLPASQISIDNVAAQLGEAVSLQDVKVSVQVAEPPADTVRIVEDTANRNSYQVVVKPVEFTITCTHEDKTVEVSKFNGYVERMVAVPEGIDPAKITTGVVLNADGTFSHVPTTIVLIDGKYYAKINSLTNSVYSVIWNPIEFQDMNGHWARGPVNDMGSRLVMSGESSSIFGPSRAITRGEFAATIVKALGLRPEMGESPFVDLQASHKHYGYILTAYQYGIMGGLPGNRFGADSELTREEAMAIVVSAMRLTKLSGALSAAEVNTIVAAYADSARVSGWARNVVAACLKSGIIGGRPGQLIAPKDIITRAEAAAIMQHFLRQAGLI